MLAENDNISHYNIHLFNRHYCYDNNYYIIFNNFIDGTKVMRGWWRDRPLIFYTFYTRAPKRETCRHIHALRIRSFRILYYTLYTNISKVFFPLVNVVKVLQVFFRRKTYEGKQTAKSYTSRWNNNNKNPVATSPISVKPLFCGG